MPPTNFHELPILDVHKENLDEIWPKLVEAIKSSTFIGLDAELSGLGAKSGINSNDIEERYRAMVASAQTRSLLSVGLSCFNIVQSQHETKPPSPSPNPSSPDQPNHHSNSTKPDSLNLSPNNQNSDSTNHRGSDSTNHESDIPTNGERDSISTNQEQGSKSRDTTANQTNQTSTNQTSLGASTNHSPCLTFECQTYNIFTLCQDNFMVEPDSLMFLVGHGFDFNLQFEKGLPYHHGADEEKTQDICSDPSSTRNVRDLFSCLVAAKKPLILHNGILDLVFLYGNLYAPLPSTMSMFVSDLDEMFPGGIYDTKTFAEYKLRLDASYLTYVFRKLQRQNHDKQSKGKRHVGLTFVDNAFGHERLQKDVLYRDCSIRDPPAWEATRSVCENFATHGWCTSNHQCPLSHDIDDILDLEVTRHGVKKAKKTKRRLKSIAFESRPSGEGNGFEDCVITLSKDDGEIGKTSVNNRVGERSTSTSSDAIIHNTHGHRAGYDAFMTGFSFACVMGQQQQQQQQQPDAQQQPPAAADPFSSLTDFRNKMFLSRKDFQLTIAKSAYGKVSREHRLKMERVKSQDMI